MTKNIRYRGAVQPIAEYNQEVKAHQKVADREYDGTYRGAQFHHNKGEDAAHQAAAQHEATVMYRGATDKVVIS